MFTMHGNRHCGPRGSRRWGPFAVSWEVDASDMGHNGRGRRGRMFDGSELRLILLKLIEEQPRHGYDLIREIEARTNGAYAPSPGVVYPTLTMLDEMGMIDEQKAEGAKKLFAITTAGQTLLTEREEEVEALMARLAEMGAERTRPDSASVRRAMGNLRSVLMHRFQRGQIDPDTLHKIVALIDETAQKIERLD